MANAAFKIIIHTVSGGIGYSIREVQYFLAKSVHHADLVKCYSGVPILIQSYLMYNSQIET